MAADGRRNGTAREDAVPEYRVRNSLFRRAALYRLEGQGLRVRKEGAADLWVPYHSIRRVCLTRTSTRYIPDLYRCRLWISGGRRLVLSNQHYAPPGGFKDLGPEYARLVRGLHQRLQGLGVEFVRGVGSLAYWSMVGLTLFVGTFLLTLMGIGLLGGHPLLLLFSLVGAFGLIWLVYLFQKRNRLQPYDPGAIPPELLPPEQEENE